MSDGANGTADDVRPSSAKAGARPTVERLYDPMTDGELVIAMVSAIADARGVSPLDLRSPPLYDCIDVGALEDAFFGPDGTVNTGVRAVEFPYVEFRVKVSSDGRIQIFENN